MKIAIVCDVLGEPNNGTTIAALNLIEHMKKAGHDVRVVSPDESTRGRPGYYVVPRLNLGRFLNGRLAHNGVQLAKPDRAVLRQAFEGADVVHLLFPFPLACAGAELAREMGLPITASFHCQAENFTSHLGLMNCKPVNRLVYRVFYNKVYRLCSAIHYPTEFIREEFEGSVSSLLNGRELPGHVISNGVNDVFFEERPGERISDKFTIACIGRFSKEKAQHTLIEAAAGSRYRDRIKIVLAGDGPLKERLRRQAERLGVDCEMRFFTREGLASMLRGADLYVHTSVAEIEAISCLEAMVCGLVPVICSSEESATRFFAPDGLCLYKKEDASDLTSRIEFFMEHPEAVEERRRRISATLRNYNQHECMCAMEDMFREAIAVHARRMAAEASEQEAAMLTARAELVEAKLIAAREEERLRRAVDINAASRSYYGAGAKAGRRACSPEEAEEENAPAEGMA